MANLRYFAIYEKATGRLVSQASIDLDDTDTAIDEATGKPYSKSGLRGVAHPGVIAGTHEYRKNLAAGITEVKPRRNGAIDRGLQVAELSKDPTLPPDGDPDGRQEWDEVQRRFVDRSGTELRRRQLLAVREREAALQADMTTRGETVPPRDTRG